MIFDLETAREIPTEGFDVCVIGAGAAGITMALELSSEGLSVLLLEGGGAQHEEASQDLYRSELPGLPHQGIHEGRFRVFGGTTTKWGGQILELDALDFQSRPWVPGSGWPISKDDLREGYARALEVEGVAASLQRDADVWARAGVEPLPLGPDLEPFFTRWCPQPDFAKLYGKALAATPGIRVYLHANVCELVLGDARETIAGVRCRTFTGRTVEFQASRYVICLGAIETARLLLQPLPGGGAAPWNASGMVGRYFQDHLDVPVARLIPRNREKFHLWADNIYLNGYRYVPKIRASAQLQERLQTLAVGAAFQFRSVRQDAFAVRDMLNRFRRGDRGIDREQLASILYASDVLVRKAWRFLRHKRAYNPDDMGTDLFVHCEQAPDQNSRLTLSEDRDSLGMLRSRLHWRVGEAELNSVRKFTAYLAEQFEAAGIAQTEVYSHHLQDLESFAAKAHDSYHHMGTARMSRTPADGVVDVNCQLHGVHNGFVCSSAVFPTSGFSNPTHTILALGVRLARFLARAAEGRGPAAVHEHDPLPARTNSL